MASERLPEAFHRARCIVQATSGHGVKPDIRLRLWYWLSRPVTGGELQRWIGAVVDPASFRAVQIIYTAAPIFDGLVDPIRNRIAKLPGDDMVAVPSIEELAPPPERPPLPPPLRRISDRYINAACADAARIIASAPKGTRHNVLLSEGGSLLRFVPQRLSATDFVHAMMGAARTAGLDTFEADELINWLLGQIGGVP